jgi:hypothetical protein
MLRAKRFDELENMFNNGLNMNALPVGVAAGAGGAVLETGSPLFSKLLDYLTFESEYLHVGSKRLVTDALESFVGRNWRGKYFFPSNNKRASKGRNRIKESMVRSRSAIVPMAKFDTMLLDSHPLASSATSNLVVLNYADPQTRPYWQELVATKVHALDLQVAVKGKYGPIFIGKTWLGKYNKEGEFTAFGPKKVVAWYFLDFNKGALSEQRKEHWDGSDEETLDPLPHVDN